MPNTLTDRTSVVTQALVDLIRTKYHQMGMSSEDDVYYGDQSRYPRFPSVAVEPGPQERTLKATGLQQRVSFDLSIFVYHGPLVSQSYNAKQTDALAETLIDIVHSDRQLGGYLIHSHITAIEPGAVRRGGALLVVHRLTWSGMSQANMEK